MEIVIGLVILVLIILSQWDWGYIPNPDGLQHITRKLRKHSKRDRAWVDDLQEQIEIKDRDVLP